MFSYDPHGIINILSLKNMNALHYVIYDSTSDDGSHFVVHCHTGPITFQQSPSELYFHDMRKSKTVVFTQYDVETVANNAECYTCRQLHSAWAARCLQFMTAHPSDAELSALVRCSML